MTKTKLFILTSAGSLMLFLGGCAMGGKDLPAARTYTLDSRGSCRTSRHIDATLLIAEPAVKRDLDTPSIHYSDERYSLEKYTLTRWSDTPADMLHRMIAENMSRSGLFSNVVASPVKCESDYLLQSELYRFRQEFDGNLSRGVLAIKFYLTDPKEKRLIASRMFRYRVPAESSDARGAVKALNKAAAYLTNDLCRWLSKTVRKER